MNETIDYSQIPLRDIHLPAEVGLWPPAVGWWVLGALVLAYSGWLLWRYAQGYRRRVALRTLEAVCADLEAGHSSAVCLPIVSSVVRRFAMTVAAQPRGIAGLVGERWLTWLDSQWEQHEFTNGAGQALARAPYAPPAAFSSEDALALTRVCIDWVRAQKGRS
ncbi:MAG: DUF4381 domain-containing protein [Gammaproteobacteria bacterium]|jgi:hypothetical protein